MTRRASLMTRRAVPGLAAVLNAYQRRIDEATRSAARSALRAKAARRALRRSKARFRALSEHASDLVQILDADGAIRYASPSHKSLLGYAPAALLTANVFGFLHPDDRAQAAERFALRVQGGDAPRYLTLRFQHADGSWRILDVIATSRLDDPAVRGVIVTGHDVTVRMRAEETLRLSEARFRALSEHASDLVRIVDAEGIIRYASPSHQRLLGYAPADLVGRSIFGFMHPDDVPHAQAQAHVQTRDSGAAVLYTFRIQHANGSWRWQEAVSSNHLDDPAIQGFVVNGRDITERRQMEETLRASERDYRTLIEQAADGIFLSDPAGRFVEVNARACALLGYTRDDLLRLGLADVIDAANLIGTPLRVAEIDAGAAIRGERRVRRKDGVVVPVEVSATLLADGRLQAIVRDITAQVRARKELERSEASLAEAQRIAHLGDWDLDLATQELRWSDEIYRIFGVAPRTFTPTTERILSLVHPADRAGLAAALNGRQGYNRDYRIRRPDGAERTLHTQAEVVRDEGGRAVRLRGTVQDVTERVRAEEALRHQARHDALTGLPNRALLHERMAAALGDEADAPRPLALLLLDLDHFKEVNDTFGHEQGDALLCQVAARLRGAVRGDDTVARLGGDEFAVLLPGCDAPGAARVAADIRAALAAPLRVEGQALQTGASVGIALGPAHGTDGPTLLRRADVAMYTAKRARRGHALYEPAQDQHSAERLALVADLRAAIERGTLALHYQPQVDVASGRACGVEALVRWPHPERGPIPPDAFIPLAEQTGLIAPLTDWVLAEAVRQGRAWQRGGLLLDVSVNLSMWNLHDPALPERVAGLLRDHGLPPAWLRLELTESALMADPERALEVLTRLAGLGVRLAVDDFGAGYSSLAYLKRLPVDALKIDKGFVRELATDATDAAIVASTVALGHALGLRVVAEGIEDRATWDLLAGMGCDVAQGYYLSRPLPPDALAPWLLREAPWAVALGRRVG